jgi:uncharacterized YigZ family protein
MMISDDSRKSYITPSKYAISEITEKKSVFHAWVAPVSSQEEAVAWITKAKSAYPDARHHVYAWILGGNTIQNKFSDDGEPAGTASLPILDVLRKNGIEDAIVIVIRYFGGTLLGTGGLVRAYTASASMALAKSEPITMKLCTNYRCTTDYSDFEKIKRHLADTDFEIEVKEYGEKIIFDVSCEDDKKDALLAMVADISNGKASLSYNGNSYKKSQESNLNK